MAIAGAPVSYTSNDGATLTLYPWSGRQVAMLTASSDLDPAIMDRLLDGLDRAFDVYVFLTGREPSLYRNHNGLASIAQVPTTFGTNGGALGWLGSTGIELSQDVWTRLYNNLGQTGRFDQAVFYEFGRNFWFYGPQLGAVDPFVTGFAILNRFISMEQAGLAGSPFNDNLAFGEFRTSILEDLAQAFLTNGVYTLSNTVVVNAGVASPYNWGAADLAGSLLYQVYEDFGLTEYRDFYSALRARPTASNSASAINNFLEAAQVATGIDYSFLNKAQGTGYLTGGRGADTLTSRGDGTPTFGFGGNDTLFGSGVADLLFGDSGNDTLWGGLGNDQLVGGLGADTLRGEGGDDRLYGGAEADRLEGGAGNDIIHGGDGVDVSYYEVARSASTIKRNSDGSITVTAGADGTDILFNAEKLQFSDVRVSVTTTFADPGAPLVSNFAVGAGGWSSQNLYPRHVADVNGDGFSDIVSFGQAGALVSFGSAGGRFSAPGLAIANFGQASGWSSDNQFHRELADVNGDGRADIIGFGIAGTLVSFARANGTFADLVTGILNFGANQGWATQDGFARAVGDINGDGKADLIGFGFAGTLVSLGNGDGTFKAATLALANFGVQQGWTSDDLFHRTVADVNGDGRDDIIGFGFAGTLIALAKGDGTFNTAKFALNNFGRDQGWSTQNSFARDAADVNGDGFADVVGFGIVGTLVAYGQANGDFTPARLDVNNFGANQGWISDNTYHRELADINNDGTIDIVGFGFAGVLAGYNQATWIL